jgi:hypothetical protein
MVLNLNRTANRPQGTLDVATLSITSYRRSARRSLCYLANKVDAVECMEKAVSA